MPAEEPSETPSKTATERTKMHDFSSGKSFHSGFPLKFLKNSVQNGSAPFGDRKGLKPKKPDAIECFFASIPSGDSLLSRNERIQKTLKIQCLMRRAGSSPALGTINHEVLALPGFSFTRYPLGQKSINGPFLLGPAAMFFWERKRFIFDFVAPSP